MGDKKPKRQHSVPKVLIKNFLNQAGRVWVGDRERGRVFTQGWTTSLSRQSKWTVGRSERLIRSLV